MELACESPDPPGRQNVPVDSIARLPLPSIRSTCSILSTAKHADPTISSKLSSRIVIVADPNPASEPTPQNSSVGHGAFEAGCPFGNWIVNVPRRASVVGCAAAGPAPTASAAAAV